MDESNLAAVEAPETQAELTQDVSEQKAKVPELAPPVIPEGLFREFQPAAASQTKQSPQPVQRVSSR